MLKTGQMIRIRRLECISTQDCFLITPYNKSTFHGVFWLNDVAESWIFSVDIVSLIVLVYLNSAAYLMSCPPMSNLVLTLGSLKAILRFL